MRVWALGPVAADAPVCRLSGDVRATVAGPTFELAHRPPARLRAARRGHRNAIWRGPTGIALTCALASACVTFVGVARANPEDDGARHARETQGAEADEGAAQNIAVAEDLLARGKALLEKGQTEAARELLVVSMARHPVPETYLMLGECEEKLGKGLAAWLLFEKAHRAARGSGDPAAAAEASRRASAVAPTLTRLKVRVPPGVKDPTILVDGRKLEPTEIDVAVPIDPGNHTLEVVSGGKRTFAMKFGFEFPKQLKEVPLPARFFRAISPATEPPPKGPTRSDVGIGFMLAGIGASAVATVFFDVAEGERDEHFIAPTAVAGAVALGLVATGLILTSTKDRPKKDPDPLRNVHPFRARVVPMFDVAPTGGVRSAGIGLRGTF